MFKLVIFVLVIYKLSMLRNACSISFDQQPSLAYAVANTCIHFKEWFISPSFNFRGGMNLMLIELVALVHCT